MVGLACPIVFNPSAGSTLGGDAADAAPLPNRYPISPERSIRLLTTLLVPVRKYTAITPSCSVYRPPCCMRLWNVSITREASGRTLFFLSHVRELVLPKLIQLKLIPPRSTPHDHVPDVEVFDTKWRVVVIGSILWWEPNTISPMCLDSPLINRRYRTVSSDFTFGTTVLFANVVRFVLPMTTAGTHSIPNICPMTAKMHLRFTWRSDQHLKQSGSCASP